MLFQTGMIVRSKKGHDKGRFYAVHSISGNNVLLTDGDTRKGDRLKKKNMIHLAPTKTVLNDVQLASDSEIRKILAVFDGRVALPKEVK